jgi:hypothetical protein
MKRRAFRIRDFHRPKHRQNPFFVRRRPSQIWPVLKAVGLFAIAGGIVYGIFYSPLLRINRFEVSGAVKCDSATLRAALARAVSGYDYLVVPKDHLFFADASALSEALEAQFLDVRNADVRKQFGKITANVEERSESLRLIIADKSYLLDQGGIGMREAVLGEGDNLVAIENDSAVFSPGAKMISAPVLAAVTEIHKYFATQTGIKDRLIRIAPDDSTIEVVSSEGWYAILDPSVDIEIQLASVSTAVLGKFSPADRTHLDYIDARLGDKIFYKWK